MSALIFITGTTGFIGNVTLRKTLEAGYKVRIAVRQQFQVEDIKKRYAKYAPVLDFTVVPDITAPGAYAGKLEGVDAILHLASPLAKGINKEEIIPPAINGTLEILREAKKVASVKKVVITASIVSVLPVNESIPAGAIIKEEGNPWTVDVTADDDFTGRTDHETSFRIYRASKVLADKASRDFVRNEKPGFTLISLHPTFVFGHNELQTTAEGVQGGTNGILWAGIMVEGATSNPFGYVHVEDVADAQVLALGPKIDKDRAFILAGQPNATWDDLLTVVKEDYPHLPYKLTADGTRSALFADTSRAEQELGIKWRSLRQTVHEVVDQQLGFMSK